MNKLFSRVLPLLAVSSLGALVGCSADVSSASSVEAEEGSVENVGTTSQAWTVADPTKSYFADITANGTGCPQGSATASISPDGQTFTVAFSQYEANISPSQFVSVKDCLLAVKLRTPQGLSYSVASFDYSGYAALDKAGMSATQSATYYFQGDRVDSTRGRTTVSGPYDAEYVYRDKIGVADLVWSPCGATRDLNISTRLVLKNNSSKTGSGYINTDAVNGDLKLVFGLNWRKC